MAGSDRAPLLAALFVIYGLIATGSLALIMPPFQNADEQAHFLRAALLADGHLVGMRFDATAGGRADPAIGAAAGPFLALPFHPEAKATAAMWAPRVHWTGQRALTGFANTAIYPPPFYLPAAIGVLVGQATRMTVVETLILSRVLTGVASVTLAGAAIALAGGAAVWLFALLTLPMSLSLTAACSQDGLLLACAAMACTVLARLLGAGGRRDGWWLAVLTVALCLVAIARPPYAGLAVLPLGVTRLRWRWRLAAACGIAGGVAAWSWVAAATALTNVNGFVGADPAAQLARLLDNPLLAWRVARDTLLTYTHAYLHTFVGQLGWLDTELPQSYHQAAMPMLAVAALAALLGPSRARVGVTGRLTVAAGVLLAAAMVFAIQYLACTVPGNGVVEGVQGRYFLPLALVAGAGLLPALPIRRLRWLRNALVAAVAVFPLVTLPVMLQAIVLRYDIG